MNNHYVTGKALTGYLGTSNTAGVSVKERIEQWYLEPLERMANHDAFVCLAIVFLLYEKYLRRTEQMAEGEKFKPEHPVFDLIGSDLGVDRATAFTIWNNWRNGLLHRAMPLANEVVTWALSGKTDKPVTKIGNQLVLNPWLIRDKIVNKVRQRKNIWKDDKAPLMDVYTNDLD